MNIGSRSAIKIGAAVRLMLAVALAALATMLVCAWAFSEVGASGHSGFVFLVTAFPLILAAKAGWSQAVSIILNFAVYFVVGCLVVWQTLREL
jgi:hypothetical protein